MANIFDYITWRGDLTFEEAKFNQLDALILSQISYINFDFLISGDFVNKISLEKLAEKFQNSPDYQERRYMGLLINQKTPELLFEAGKSKRFKDILVCAYETKLDKKNIEQFAALCFIINKEIYVSFRGTDDTIIGWEEDFNICYLPQIPSQIDSCEYLSKIAKNLKGKIIVGGHSKGGNLAVYAATKCNEKIQKRIQNIYNFEGPGFSEEFYQQKEFLNIEKKIISIFPEYSIVGMIFRHTREFTIVKSTAHSLYQHDALSWQVLGKDFQQAEEFTDQSKFFHRAINEWLNKLTAEQRKAMVLALEEILDSAGVDTNTKLNHKRISNSRKMLQAYTNLEPEIRSSVHKILRVLTQVIQSEMPFFNFMNLEKNLQSKKQGNIIKL